MLRAHELAHLLEKFPVSFRVGTVAAFILLVFNGFVFLTQLFNFSNHLFKTDIFVSLGLQFYLQYIKLII